jgi:hypothetical protein
MLKRFYYSTVAQPRIITPLTTLTRMTRNLHKTIALTLLLALLLSGCEKYEMPGQDDDSEHSENTSTGKDNEDDGDNSYSEQYDEDDPYQGWGSLDNQINKGGTISRPYRAKDLATGKLGEWIVSYGVESMPNCWVEGYIVGYISGTSMKSAQLFETGDKESNIIIASDTIGITADDCVPIGLSTGKSYLPTRQALNLKDNHGVMLRKVKILGSLCKYMGVAGLKNAKDYKFTDNK